jgi:hypothetical protein
MQYTKNSNDQFTKERIPVGWPWRLLVLGLSLLMISLLIYAGLIFGYKPFLGKSINDLEIDLAKLSSEFTVEDENDLIGFHSQITNIKNILGSHVTTSDIFKFVEDVTNKQVSYNTFILSVPERTVKIDGVAKSYGVLSAQLFNYENSPEVEKVSLESSSFTGTVVKFTIKLILKNEIFHL